MTHVRSPVWKRTVAIVATALVAAGFAIAFRGALAALIHAFGAQNTVGMIDDMPMWERVLLPALGGAAVGAIMIVAAKVRQGAGVGFVMEAIVLGRSRLPLIRSCVQALATWCAIASGNSLGREGPLIQFGAAAGEGARRVLALDDISARIVLAAGVAAGFASAYNAPIAAVLFVVEIVTGVIVLEAIVPMLIAVVIATIATRYIVGGAPLYGLRALNFTSPAELIAFAGLGLVAAPVGVLFLRMLGWFDHLFRVIPMPWRPMLGGALVGGSLCLLPMIAGNGFEPLNLLLDGRLAIATVAWLLIAKPLATATAVGSGNPGGAFTPTLLIGGCVGTLYGAGLHWQLGDAVASSGAYALVGLAAGLAATTHAPLTATVLACEISGDWRMVLPLLVATALSSGLARRLYIDSVYTAELTRRGLRWRLTLEGRRVVENQGQTVDVV